MEPWQKSAEHGRGEVRWGEARPSNTPAWEISWPSSPVKSLFALIFDAWSTSFGPNLPGTSASLRLGCGDWGHKQAVRETWGLGPIVESIALEWEPQNGTEMTDSLSAEEPLGYKRVKSKSKSYCTQLWEHGQSSLYLPCISFCAMRLPSLVTHINIITSTTLTRLGILHGCYHSLYNCKL